VHTVAARSVRLEEARTAAADVTAVPWLWNWLHARAGVGRLLPVHPSVELEVGGNPAVEHNHLKVLIDGPLGGQLARERA